MNINKPIFSLFLAVDLGSMQNTFRSCASAFHVGNLSIKYSLIFNVDINYI